MEDCIYAYKYFESLYDGYDFLKKQIVYADYASQKYITNEAEVKELKKITNDGVDQYDLLQIATLFPMITIGQKFNEDSDKIVKELWRMIDFPVEQLEDELNNNSEDIITKEIRDMTMSINDFKKIYSGDKSQNWFLQECQCKPLCVEYNFSKALSIYIKCISQIMKYSKTLFLIQKKEALEKIGKDLNVSIDSEATSFQYPQNEKIKINLLTDNSDRIISVAIVCGVDAEGVSFVGDIVSSKITWKSKLSEENLPTSLAKNLYVKFCKISNWEWQIFGEQYLKVKT